MPQQEPYFEQQVGDKRVLVLKSYDRAFARDSFDHMGPEALTFLQNAASVNSADLANLSEADRADLLWEEIEDSSREDWNTFSYFIVSEETAGKLLPLFVSADWPSAEAFAKQCVAP